MSVTAQIAARTKSRDPLRMAFFIPPTFFRIARLP